MMIELAVLGVFLFLVFVWINRSSRPDEPPPNYPERTTTRPQPKTRSQPTSPARPVAVTGQEICGKCHVIDGDTIMIGKVKIRLSGIDAPELDQPYGRNSKWAMVGICKGNVITARLNGETSHDRLVGTCFLPDGRDIGAELIKAGLAVDWPMFSGGRYRHFEPAGVRQKLRRPPYDH